MMYIDRQSPDGDSGSRKESDHRVLRCSYLGDGPRLADRQEGAMRVFAAFLVLHLTGCVYLLEKPRNESWKSEAQLAASRPSDSALVEPSQAEAQSQAAPVVTPPGKLKQVVDVDEIPALGVRERENAYAVVIGIEQYRERLPKADYSANDARIMGEYLTKVLGYSEKNVVVRVNEKAAKGDLEKYFGPWLRNNVDPGSSVFVFYSGHGAPNPKTGDAYLVPYDGDPTYVETTAYSLKRLYADLESLPAKEVVVMVDSCFSGAGGRSVIAKGTKPVGISVEGSLRPWGKIKV